MALQPAQPRRFVDLAEVAAHRVLAQHLAHAKQRRVHRIAAQRRNVGIAPMTGQNRQQHGAKQIALARGIRAAERQWAVRYPAIEQPALLQVLDEERQLPEWRHRRRRVPLHVNPAPSRSWTSAECTSAPTSKPQVSVTMWRLRPLTFLAAS